jgi:hypothetical protein
MPGKRETAEKVRENRLRRMATRRGLVLVKSRRRDPGALDFGAYWLLDERNRHVSGEVGMDLDGIQAFLTGNG